MSDNVTALTNSSVAEVAKLLPVLIAAATMLAMVNLRNSDLATRFRNNVLEVRKKDTSPGRRQNPAFKTSGSFFDTS
jgi:hypothetical protein